MNSRGLSLIELVVVLSVLAILLSVATLDFNSWQRKYQTESQTREMFADLEQFRLNAIQRKQRSVAFIGPKSYVFRTYTSAAQPLAGGTVVFRKTLDYEIRKDLALTVFNIASDVIEFDTRGYTNNLMTIIATPVQYSAGDNCIIVSTGQTNLGRMLDAATCRPR
jgi:prepilin-type N-terminal cleavage/methylation domain-containing protein